MLNDMKMITVYVIVWGHMFKPILKKSMGGARGDFHTKFSEWKEM